VQAGGDPAQEKRARRLAPKPEADDFASVAREYLERQVKRNTAASTYRETARIIDQDVIPKWGKRSIRSIAKRDVIVLIDAKVATGAEVQANRVLARLRTLFGWAVEKDRIAANPCEGLRPPTKEKARDRVLSDGEIRAFRTATGELGWPFGPLFRMLLLTAQRRDELATLDWGEVDLEDRLWSLPREKAKNDHGHDVHLSSQAVEILEALPRVAGGLAFSTNGRTAVSGFSRAKERLDDLMAKALGGPIEPWILHDLRRTAATGMAALKIRGVAWVYNRFEYRDERKMALEAWGRKADAIVSGVQASNVVDFSAASA
jgi:integrase